MESLIIHPTDTAQWHALINEAQAVCAVNVTEDVESYLVFLLMRFTGQAHLASSVMAVDFLEGSQASGRVREQRLQEVGDKCLLFSGLFPGRAERFKLTIRYFIELGQAAYGNAADNSSHTLAALFGQLSQGFEILRDVLHATRRVSASEQLLSLATVEAEFDNQPPVSSAVKLQTQGVAHNPPTAQSTRYAQTHVIRAITKRVAH
ncbi:MAG: hypothetical protein Tsb005_04630 [Gammaproteobacteria bacterium]